LRNEAVPAFYQPFRPGGTANFAIRTTLDPGHLVQATRKVIADVDPAVPLTEFHTQSALIDFLLRTERLLSFVSGAFGLVALLAAIGLGGLLAYAVAVRTNEIGVGMALGAAAADVVPMVLRDSLWMVAAGAVIGVPCAYAVGNFLRTALFGLQLLDIPTHGLAFSALVAVAPGAAWIPARRAARTDPVVALRVE
jgi:ABC-type antimicrobial peptide transport system permease subunit